jgi:hypothetical protein
MRKLVDETKTTGRMTVPPLAMKKLTSVIASAFLAFVSIEAAPETSVPAPSAADESRRANEFLDKCFDEFAATHPQIETSLGIKTHNDQWSDISDEAAKRDLETEQKIWRS